MEHQSSERKTHWVTALHVHLQNIQGCEISQPCVRGDTATACRDTFDLNLCKNNQLSDV